MASDVTYYRCHQMACKISNFFWGETPQIPLRERGTPPPLVLSPQQRAPASLVSALLIFNLGKTLYLYIYIYICLYYISLYNNNVFIL